MCPSRRAQSPIVAAGRQPRARPPSPLGRLLLDRLQEDFEGNVSRFAMALEVSRQTLYVWLRSPAPPIPEIRHRERIARLLRLNVSVIDTMIVTAMGYRVTSVDARAVGVAVLANKLDDDDIAQVQRDLHRRLRRRRAQ